jgi:hypothetical protein
MCLTGGYLLSILLLVLTELNYLNAKHPVHHLWVWHGVLVNSVLAALFFVSWLQVYLGESAKIWIASCTIFEAFLMFAFQMRNSPAPVFELGIFGLPCLYCLAYTIMSIRQNADVARSNREMAKD